MTEARSREGKKISELVEYLEDNGLRVHLEGSPQEEIHRVNTLQLAEKGDITFLSNRKYANLINRTQASAIILPETLSAPENIIQIKVDDSYYAMTLITRYIHGERIHPFTGIDPASSLDKSAKIGKNAAIAPNVTVCKQTIIGDNSTIYPGCFIGPMVTIGNNVLLYPNVTIYDNTVLGDNVTIHAGTVIGEDGFGYATHDGIHHKIPQIGNVIIEDDVEIGANCSIDRATIGSTLIGKGSKFSNLIAIGHGTKVGEHCLLVAQVGIAGSTQLGHHVTMGGQVGVVGHITIGNYVNVGAQSGVAKNVGDKQVILGAPAVPIQDARRQMLLLAKLPEMRQQIKSLQKQLDKLEREQNN